MKWTIAFAVFLTFNMKCMAAYRIERLRVLEHSLCECLLFVCVASCFSSWLNPIQVRQGLNLMVCWKLRLRPKMPRCYDQVFASPTKLAPGLSRWCIVRFENLWVLSPLTCLGLKLSVTLVKPQSFNSSGLTCQEKA